MTRVSGAGEARASGPSSRSSQGSGGHYPLHPFLFAIVSVLVVLASELNEAAPEDTWPTLAGAVVFAALVYGAAAALRRRLDAATAVIASIWIVGCLYYGALLGPLNRMLDGGYSMTRSLPFALVAMVVLSLLAWRLARWMRPVHIMLNVVAAVLLVTPLWQTAAYAWRNFPARDAYDADRAAAAMPVIGDPDGWTADGVERPPDIYHFIFDRYARQDVLRSDFGIDDSETGRFLEQNGFFVTTGSFANYPKTGPSLASTFYMDYLDHLADRPDLNGANWHPIYDMLDDHRVGRFLKARGYEFLQFGSWWKGTAYNPLADENHPYAFSEFATAYLKKTVAKPVFHLLPDSGVTMRLDWDNGQCQRVADQLRRIEATGEGEKPTYVFAHVLVPHGPYVFAPDGSCLTQKEAAARGEQQGYADQIAYAGRMIRELVTALQGREDKPVIIIQADEGPFPEWTQDVPWQEAPAEELRVKTAIINAYFFPEGDYDLLYPDITPVNSYRVLFDTVFGTDLGLLEDRVYVFPHGGQLYEYHDVTDKVRSVAEEGETVSRHQVPASIED